MSLKGAYVGTILEILEWQRKNNIAFGECRYYKVGDEINHEYLFRGDLI